MKKFILLCALATNSFAAGISAPLINPWYAGVFAGAGLLNDHAVSTTINILGTDYTPTIGIHHNTAYQLGTVVGYRFNRTHRIETQLNYHYASTSTLESEIPLDSSDDIAIIGGGSSLKTLVGLLNYYHDFTTGSVFVTPFVGVGIGLGWARTSISGIYDDVPNESPSLSQTGSRAIFAYQAMAGFQYHADAYRHVYFGCRYQGMTSVKLYQRHPQSLLLDVGYTVTLH
jgi:opacity protein-like surface antigen